MPVPRASLSLRRPSVIAAASLAATALLLGVPGPDPVGAQAPSSAAAVRAQELASDPDAPGPIQPIPFSHALHAGTFQIQCLYCHSGTDRSMAAGVPSVESCMGCHSQFGGDLEGIQILKRHWDEKRPVEWVQIHRLPEHVQFPHQRHVAAGVECNTCHGPVETLHKLHLVPDTKWWPWGLPARKLQMGWCISCHRETGVSQDCFGCHY